MITIPGPTSGPQPSPGSPGGPQRSCAPGAPRASRGRRVSTASFAVLLAPALLLCLLGWFIRPRGPLPDARFIEQKGTLIAAEVLEREVSAGLVTEELRLANDLEILEVGNDKTNVADWRWILFGRLPTKFPQVVTERVIQQIHHQIGAQVFRSQ